MRQAMVWMAVIGMVVAFSGVASAEKKSPDEAMVQGLVDTVKTGCDQELKTYCKDVTMGEGRGLACLYAFSDKLSPKCEYALYDAAAQLERALTALTYVVNECRDDLTKYCSDIKPGQGRLLQCIDKNKAKVSKRCKQAIKETGLKK